MAAALPASVQSILNARVDRLSPKDRALLQAAAAIGKRFNSELLAVAAEETDIDDRLAAMPLAASSLTRRVLPTSSVKSR